MANLEKSQNIFYTSYLSKNHSLDENNYAITNDGSKEIYAKKIISNNRTKYFILIQNNCVYNPFNIYGQKRFNSLFDGKETKFIHVPIRIFKMYLEFLNSQNMSLLYNIQREVLI